MSDQDRKIAQELASEVLGLGWKLGSLEELGGSPLDRDDCPLAKVERWLGGIEADMSTTTMYVIVRELLLRAKRGEAPFDK